LVASMVRRELTEHEIKEHAEAEEVMSKLEQTDAEDPEFGQLPPSPTLCTGSSAGQHDPAPWLWTDRPHAGRNQRRNT
jgi:hypothetical protein